MALKDIKTKIQATKRTHKVTRAMEAVSAVKMRKTQSVALNGRAYARAALSVLARLTGSAELAQHPLGNIRPIKRVALVVLTSDKGLAGALNSSVIKAANKALASYPAEAVDIYAYGKKGQEYFARNGYTIAKAYENKADTVPLSTMETLTEELSDAFLQETYDVVLVAFSRFKSTFEHVPSVQQLLPLKLESLTQLVADIVPAKGKWSDLATAETTPSYTVEIEDTSMIDALISRLLAVSLYHFLLESKASEHSARMVAMKSASDKSEEIAHDLTRRFNKARQAVITREVSEIISGREALAN